MRKKYWIGTLAVAGLVGAALGTVALADRGGHGAGMQMGGGMPPFAEVDADADGKITQAEIAAWRAARTAGLDADGDGKLSKAEVKAGMLARMEARADRMVEAMFAARDSDGDGFLGVAEAMLPGAPAGMFDRLDADGDGGVTEAEIEAARERMAGRGGDGRHGGGWGGHHRGMMPMMQDDMPMMQDGFDDDN